MLLELGSGYRPYLEDGRDWVHSDMRPGPHIEMIFPAECCNEEVGDEACDEIRATHLLEHFSYRKTVQVLENWYRSLKQGGMLYLEVPHIFGHIEAFRRGEIGHEDLITYIYGEQDFALNHHHAGFSEDILRRNLKEAGYRDIFTQDIGMVLIAKGWR